MCFILTIGYGIINQPYLEDRKSMNDEKEKEKFIWYKDIGVLLVLILMAVAFINLGLGNPLGR